MHIEHNKPTSFPCMVLKSILYSIQCEFSQFDFSYSGSETSCSVYITNRYALMKMEHVLMKMEHALVRMRIENTLVSIYDYERRFEMKFLAHTIDIKESGSTEAICSIIREILVR